MVYDSVRESIPNISLGTVYRNLKALSKDGLILNFSLDGKEYFDGNTGLHMHLCCTVCGRILDRRVTLSSIEKTVSDCSDVSNIIIYGKCEACR